MEAMEGGSAAVPPQPEKKSVRRQRRRLDQVYAKALDPAVSDADLAKELDIPIEVVGGWRRSRARTRAKVELDAMIALDLGLGYQPELHITAGSISGGRWEPPMWMLRTPMEYETFCRLVYSMIENGALPEEIAAAFGTRETDVIAATEVWDRVLIGPDGRVCACSRQYVRKFESGDQCRTCATRGLR
jgi:hypothetical protein